jgi:hypothetical protein
MRRLPKLRPYIAQCVVDKVICHSSQIPSDCKRQLPLPHAPCGHYCITVTAGIHCGRCSVNTDGKALLKEIKKAKKSGKKGTTLWMSAWGGKFEVGVVYVAEEALLRIQKTQFSPFLSPASHCIRFTVGAVAAVLEKRGVSTEVVSVLKALSKAANGEVHFHCSRVKCVRVSTV